MQGIFDVETIEGEMRLLMSNLDIEYIAIVNRAFQQIKKIELKNTIILVACRVEETRLSTIFGFDILINCQVSPRRGYLFHLIFLILSES